MFNLQVTYCTSCCRWDGFTRDEEGIWESGPRNDLCNMDNSAAMDGVAVAVALFLIFFHSYILYFTYSTEELPLL